MTYIRSIILVLLAFAVHFGSMALVHVGWPPQPLVLLAVLAVWLERSPAIGRTILPAAFLVDLLQPTHVPIVTVGVLVAWFVAALVQRQWLTNHSLASLLGLSVLSVVAAAIATATGLWIAASLGTSATPVSEAWSAQGLLQRLGIEITLTFLLGVALRSSARFFRSHFLYAAR